MIAPLVCLPAKRAAKKETAVKTRTYAYHESVLMAETLRCLAPAPGKVIVDGTLGGGGHSAQLLAAGARVIGLDHDPEAIAHARKLLQDAGESFVAVRSSFTKLDEALDSLGIGQIDGGLLDLGVSSHQIDEPSRGFSFHQNGPLDMRMDPSAPLSAADLINVMSGEQLERIFRNFGEEPAARRIAARIVRDRMAKPFTTTLELAEAVEAVVPRRGKTHPATRIFQALRIAVNRELEALAEGLEVFTRRLAPGGRLAIITFHSLEDRAVKTFFKARSVQWIDRPEWPAARPNPDYIFKQITGKPIVASAEEQRENPRSRSAKLRAVERIPHVN
jgi:16S rRNA (cytosine1402-N4)-methyltransferase